VTFALLLLLCAQDEPPPKIDPIKPGQAGSETDYGPFLTSTVSRVRYRSDGDLIAHKTISIRLGDLTYAFDTDLVRPAALWSGGFLDLAGTHLVSSKGAIPTTVGGPLAWETPKVPGWARDGSFKDPRPRPSGPLPREWARYEGLYRHGRDVVLSYTVGGVPVLERPHRIEGAFIRSFRIGPSDRPLEAVVAPATAKAQVLGDGATVAAKDGLLVMRVPPRRTEVVVAVEVSTGELKGPKAADPAERAGAGPPLWPEAIVRSGQLGQEKGAYALDTLPVPEENVWKSWMRLTGIDFFGDGRAAVSTWSGDVWIVSGIDGGLEKVSWRRYAAGLYEPLGLCVRDDVVFVLGRDQITELRDLNGDGEADHYRNFNHDTHTMASYHAFAFELHKDAEGNFYYISDGQRVDSDVPMHGCVVRVSKDGTRSEILATGLRAANGMSVGPGGEITCADNQGNWIPTSRLNWVRHGGFYGFMPHHGRPVAPKDADPPLCWIPHAVDNSSGGQIWVTSDRWGPFQGGLLHTSYGTASLFHVVREEVDGLAQGGIVRFPLEFASGIMRGRFHPKDGQLYVVGLRGWQTRGARDGALQRVRYTGKAAHALLSMRTTADGLELTFTDPLDPAEGGNLDNYAAQQWNYVWSEKYGSPEFWVSNPKKQGREPVEITAAKLSADGRSVRLTIPGLKPVHQMLLRVRAAGADGSPVKVDLYLTLNRVPGGR